MQIQDLPPVSDTAQWLCEHANANVSVIEELHVALRDIRQTGNQTLLNTFFRTLARQVYAAIELEDSAIRIAQRSHYQWCMQQTGNERLENPHLFVMFNDLKPEQRAERLRVARILVAAAAVDL